MKVAHLATVTPGRSGLYETTRELVVGLQALGVDSRIVDTPLERKNEFHPGGDHDRGAPFADIAWAFKADILVDHSGLGPELDATDQPMIHVAHGTPRYTYLREAETDQPSVYSYLYYLNKMDRCKAVVTFWPEHEPYLKAIFRDKEVRVIQAPVDLDAWKPGPKQYNFAGKSGTPNIVCTDMWRIGHHPFVPLNAYALWARENPGAKLHIYGMYGKGPMALLKTMEEDGALGEVRALTKGLAHVYRAADLLITGSTVDSRSVREAMACGCPVVRVRILDVGNFRADIEWALRGIRSEVRQWAGSLFNPVKTAKQFESLLTQVVSGEMAFGHHTVTQDKLRSESLVQVP